MLDHVEELRVHHPLVGSFQLIVNMALLMEAWRTTDSTVFARKYGLNRKRVAQLRVDQWVDISRRDLQTLLSLERRLKDRETPLKFDFLSLLPHPFWDTFGQVTNGYASETNGAVVPIDDDVLSKLRNADVPLHRSDIASFDPDVMKQSNCILVGSPVFNSATELALNALWNGTEPPFAFQRPNWDVGESTPFRRSGEKAIIYQDSKGKWVTALDRWQPKKGSLPPSGALIVCRRPFDTEQDVTTMIIAGCSAGGTRKIAQELLDGTVFVPPNHLKNGVPSTFFLVPSDGTTKWYNREYDLATTKRKK